MWVVISIASACVYFGMSTAIVELMEYQLDIPSYQRLEEGKSNETRYTGYFFCVVFLPIILTLMGSYYATRLVITKFPDYSWWAIEFVAYILMFSWIFSKNQNNV
jgi:hypothetical protein